MVRKQPIQLGVLDGTDPNLGVSTIRTDQIPDDQLWESELLSSDSLYNEITLPSDSTDLHQDVTSPVLPDGGLLMYN